MSEPLSPDATLILRRIAKDPGEPHPHLALLPEEICNIITEKPGDEWSDAVTELVQHYLDDATERGKVALAELQARSMISWEKPNAS